MEVHGHLVEIQTLFLSILRSFSAHFYSYGKCNIFYLYWIYVSYINCTFLFVILSKQMFNPLKQIYFRLLLLAFLPFTISIYPDASNEHIENMLISKDKRKFSKLSKVKIWRYIDIYLLLLPFENPLVSKIKKNLCL